MVVIWKLDKNTRLFAGNPILLSLSISIARKYKSIPKNGLIYAPYNFTSSTTIPIPSLHAANTLSSHQPCLYSPKSKEPNLEEGATMHLMV